MPTAPKRDSASMVFANFELRREVAEDVSSEALFVSWIVVEEVFK